MSNTPHLDPESAKLIPIALRERPQWVVWGYSGPERRKRPYDAATGRSASTANPATWHTFERAHAAFQRGGYAGLGYVFSADDPFVGVDLDDCVVDGVVAPWARTILGQLASYAEISPSGTGVKVWVRGQVARGIRRAGAELPATIKPVGLPGGVEIYGSGRFFTVTAERLPDLPPEPMPAQPALDQLVAALCPPPAEQQLTQAIAARSATLAEGATLPEWAAGVKETIRSYVARAGDGERHNHRYAAGRLAGGLIALGLASEAEMTALILHANPPHPPALNQERKAIRDGITAGMRAPLAIPARYQQARAPAGTRTRPTPTPRTTTPGDRTAAEPWPNSASGGPTTTELGPNSAAPCLPGRLITARQLADLPPTRYLVEGVLPAGDLATLYGASGAGKSFVLVDLAATVAQQHPVIYVAAEALHSYSTRQTAWQARHGRSTDQLYWWTDAVNLLSPGEVHGFIASVVPLRPALIILDTLARCMSGGDENSARDMGLAVESAERIRRETGATVLICHHTGKSGQSERGSSALRGACGTMIELSNEDGLLIMRCDKARSSAPFSPRYYRLLPAGASVVLAPANRMSARSLPVSERQRQVLEVLNRAYSAGTATFTEILDGMDIAKSSLSGALSRLIELGYITREKEVRQPRITLTDAGRQFIEDAELGDHAEQFEAQTELGTLNWQVAVPDGSASADLPDPQQDAEIADLRSPSSIRVPSQFDPDPAVRSVVRPSMVEQTEPQHEPMRFPLGPPG